MTHPINIPCEHTINISSSETSASFFSPHSHHFHLPHHTPHRHISNTIPSSFTEKLLGSYENSGWIEQHSLPKPKPWKYYQKLPTSTGGPIIICLDTSWSMSGPRESLAKAVVLGRY